MDKTIKLDMIFDSDTAPDFGSIRLTACNRYDVREYVLKSADIDKLNSITNAADGSMALCTDTVQILVKHLDKWEVLV